jgi:TonB family protein
MKRRDFSLTVATCVSLTLHTALCIAMAEMYVRDGEHIFFKGFDRSKSLLYLQESNPFESQDEELGEALGKGTAASSNDAETPMLARRADQDQAWLSHEPSAPGAGQDAISSAMSEPTQPQPQQQQSQRRSNEVAIANAKQPFGLPTDPYGIAAPYAVRPPSQTADLATAVASAAPPAAVMSQAMPAASKRGGDPAPKAESDSDPFSTVGNVDFRAGKVDARVGRKYRITRPIFNLGSFVDMTTLPGSSVVLRMYLDDAGNVVNVEIAKSSGSNSIDQPCKLAAYRWWFEPRKNKPDDNIVTLTLRFY